MAEIKFRGFEEYYDVKYACDSQLVIYLIWCYNDSFWVLFKNPL